VKIDECAGIVIGTDAMASVKRTLSPASLSIAGVRASVKP
jgi:hypothetical protein